MVLNTVRWSGYIIIVIIFLDNEKENGGKIYVHCLGGISRYNDYLFPLFAYFPWNEAWGGIAGVGS